MFFLTQRTQSLYAEERRVFFLITIQVDVKKARITAFKIIANNGSQRISESEVLPGLAISLLEEALQRSRQQDNTEVGTWFLAQIQASPQ